MGKNKNGKATAVARRALPTNKLKKDPGIPNLHQQHKQLQKIANKRADATRRLEGHGEEMVIDHETNPVPLAQGIANLVAASAKNSYLGENTLDHPEDGTPSRTYNNESDPTMAAHAHQFKKVLELSDVILQVLDARDPLGCRSKLMEDELMRAGGNKKMILILNKTDLVPKDNVVRWLRYLRHEYPTIPFKSSTQHQKTHLSSSFSAAAAKGTPHLLHLLKSIRPAHQSITVGVLGPPNVGKSSLINSIKREKVCTVGAKPGETRALKEVVIERGIRVVDTPGIVWGDSEGGSSELRNVWSLEALDDPVGVVEAIVSRVSPETLQQIYSVPSFQNFTEFLVMIALSRGKLGKGGKPDISASALVVVHDWNIGKIPYFTEPPIIHPSQLTSVLPPPLQSVGAHSVLLPTDSRLGVEEPDPYASTSIVSNWAKPFDLDGLWNAADSDVLGPDGAEMEGVDVDEPEGFVPDNYIIQDDSGPVFESDDLISRSSSRLNRSHSLSTTIPDEQNLPLLSSRQSREHKSKQPQLPSTDVLELNQVASMNPLSRKRLREDSKRKRKMENAMERLNASGPLDEDVAMSISDV